MKPEFDQEMDSLLRAHARTATTARARATTAAHDEAIAHLDADELSAYAEHALPASARTRYAAHLADCDTCRAQVATLARAAGIADQLEQHAARRSEITASVSWRERFAALFTSNTWRYAMPVVALVFVSGIVLWVMTGIRSKREAAPQQIASATRTNEAPQMNHAPADEQTASGIASNNAAPAPAASANANANIDFDKSLATPAPTVPPGDLLAQNKPTEQPGARPGVALPAQVSPPSNNPVGATQNAEPVQSTSAPQTMIANSNAGAGLSSNQTQQQTAQNVYAPAPPVGGLANKSEANQQAAKSAETRATTAEQPRKRAAELDDRDAKRGRDEPGNEDEAAVHGGPSRSLSAPKTRRAEESKDKQPAEKETLNGRRESDSITAGRASATDTSETRKVGGHKFHRQNGAWVDAAYKSGQATVNVQRDSEQWRALSGDEPGLRRIADALGGEVVIVWKGRAYRIKQ
jgi:hypothetical protein